MTFPWLERLAELSAQNVPEGWELQDLGSGNTNHGPGKVWRFSRHNEANNAQLEVELAVFKHDAPTCGDSEDDAGVMVVIFAHPPNQSDPTHPRGHKTLLASTVQPAFLENGELVEILQRAFEEVEQLNPVD